MNNSTLRPAITRAAGLARIVETLLNEKGVFGMSDVPRQATIGDLFRLNSGGGDAHNSHNLHPQSLILPREDA